MVSFLLPLGIRPWMLQNFLKITFAEIKRGILFIKTLSLDSPISLGHSGLKNSHLEFLAVQALVLLTFPSQNLSYPFCSFSPAAPRVLVLFTSQLTCCQSLLTALLRMTLELASSLFHCVQVFEPHQREGTCLLHFSCIQQMQTHKGSSKNT